MGVEKIEDKKEGTGRGSGGEGKEMYAGPVVSRSWVCAYELSSERISRGTSADCVCLCQDGEYFFVFRWPLCVS